MLLNNFYNSAENKYISKNKDDEDYEVEDVEDENAENEYIENKDVENEDEEGEYDENNEVGAQKVELIIEVISNFLNYEH